MNKRLCIVTSVTMLGLAAAAGAAEKKVIIGFKKGAAANEEQKRQRVNRSGGHLKRLHTLINAISARIPEEQIEVLKKDPAVAYVEPDVTVGLTEPVTGLSLSPEYDSSWGVARIGGAEAAAAGFTGAGVKVAILDSGIDCTHPDLNDNCRTGYNFAYDNNDTFDDGYISHGTHIAGIIGARNNGTGVVGVAPAAELYPVKVLGGMVMGDLSDILAGMEWSIANKMNVINLSIGAPMDSPSFKDVCDRAFQAGIVVVSAGGNAGGSLIDFPAAYDSVIAVGATNQDNTIATFSNYGPKIELAAPGVNISSTVRGGGYGVMRGTSQATAFVSGAAAVLFSKKIADTNGDGRSADEIRTLLASSATDLGATGRDPYFGYGLINLTAALTPPPTPPATQEYQLVQKAVLKVPLKPGTYTIQILDQQMPVQVLVNDTAGTRWIDSGTCRKRATADRVFKVAVGDDGTLIFFPGGKKGSTTRIRITPLQ